jgi:hypothetical protein
LELNEAILKVIVLTGSEMSKHGVLLRTIADKDGIYIDGKSFKIARRTANVEVYASMEATPILGIAPHDAVVGQFLFWSLHEIYRGRKRWI